MRVKEFLENFCDYGGSIIRLIDDDRSFDTRIGYNRIDKNCAMWRNFIAMYGEYIITEWYVENYNENQTTYKIISLLIKENNGEGKFDYNISYTIDGWDKITGTCKVHKSQLADVIEDAFANGGYNMEISCVERNDD